MGRAGIVVNVMCVYGHGVTWCTGTGVCGTGTGVCGTGTGVCGTGICVWVCYVCWKCVVDKDVVNVREIYFMYELWGHVRVWACMGYVYFIYEPWGHVRVWGRMGYG